MNRAPFQVLVFLRRVVDGASEYLLLKRSDMDVWQGVAGGGEGEETPSEAAIREIFEETGVLVSDVIDLEFVEMLSALDVAGYYRWGEEIETIPEYAFYVDIASDVAIRISEEHAEYRWCGLEQALELLEWNSNKRAVRKIALLLELSEGYIFL